VNPIQKKTHHHTRIANMLKCSRILSNSVYKDIQVGAILKRIPIVTKSLTPYEKDYYEYKQGLYNRMAIDFPKDYYYPPGTMKTTDNEVTFNSRVTKADKENNLTKLDRSLENDLYLIVKEQNKWVFPTFKNNEEVYKQLVKDNKSLDLLSVSNLIELGGENMQLWSISKTPCKLLNNTFYFKSIIFSGEFKNDKVEHKWLNKKELIYKDNKYVEYNDNGRQKTDVDHVVLVEDVKSELIDESAKKNTDNEVTFNSRVTKADKENNLTKLDRSLENDLYLIVKEQNKWVFPTFKNNEEVYKQLVKDNKSLDLLSVSNLIELGGENMQLWSISKTPCKLLNNTFYFKSIIFSGEFKNDKVEHKWLNKKELKDVLNAEYYKEMEYLLN